MSGNWSTYSSPPAGESEAFLEGVEHMSPFAFCMLFTPSELSLLYPHKLFLLGGPALTLSYPAGLDSQLDSSATHCTERHVSSMPLSEQNNFLTAYQRLGSIRIRVNLTVWRGELINL